jgi:predicted RNase H-like HicB family nuclease
MPVQSKTKRKIVFNVIICVEQDGDSYYAHCPSLKGLHVDGDTLEEAISNVKIAVALYLKSLIKHGDPIPLQLIQRKELKEHCEIESRGKRVVPGFPHSELVQVPV